MIVGYALLRLHLPAAQSLKDKRQVVRSVLERVKGRFNVAAAEVGNQSRWQLADIGIVCASTDHAHADALLRAVREYLAESRLDIEVIEVLSDTLTVG
ncbi:MAG: DUF503 domain-containing protein [Chloroflexi bacterium]|jgi:uncharacterized protein YlxP (DUF503 family)|nr:DUF503 domain-containing protein [Chloroflexota bacterium]GIW10682.1 MAG: hypothetical protein KatS3mg061_1739 [Dehalococcoidia bacterium]